MSKLIHKNMFDLPELNFELNFELDFELHEFDNDTEPFNFDEGSDEDSDDTEMNYHIPAEKMDFFLS
jgi:hypothetical protein